MKTRTRQPSGGLPPIVHSPVEATVNFIGGKYKSLILWRLTEGTLRFSQLRREVPCATPKMLTRQLRELESDGLVRREVFPVVPPRVEYSLTPLGKSIKPVIKALAKWGTEYLEGKCEPERGKKEKRGKPRR